MRWTDTELAALRHLVAELGIIVLIDERPPLQPPRISEAPQADPGKHTPVLDLRDSAGH